MSRNNYKKGDWLAICDSCGRTFYASKLRQRWDGIMVCSDDYETRNPQDFARGIPDYMSPPWVRPKDPEQEITSVSGGTTLTASTFSVLVTTNPGAFYTITLPTAASNSGFVLRTEFNIGTVLIGTQPGDTVSNYPGSLAANSTYLFSSNGNTTWTVTNG